MREVGLEELACVCGREVVHFNGDGCKSRCRVGCFESLGNEQNYISLESVLLATMPRRTSLAR